MESLLRKCNYLLECIATHSKEAYDTTITYFQQEGLFETCKYAIVDSGWTGSLQVTLNHLLDSAEQTKKRNIEGFYFGLYELPKQVEENAYHTFYFAPYKDIKHN